MRTVSKDEYLEDIVLQRAVEQSLMNAIQSERHPLEDLTETTAVHGASKHESGN
ncbi:hypothetical protein [Saliphagus infecundisoli]|uniref:Uncharacterized protein n=1 Tax=Saliphagus infecundisoli TaxID=1849069 RepID=A0ABD5QB00_9EURY|nr:hypothetical protein [Saliphagus infecundisoli]